MNAYQRGALSLWWCAVLMAMGTMVALTFLFSVRGNRNLFEEGWDRLQHSAVGQQAQQAQSAAAAGLKGRDTGMRKCKINGATVYSNVDCRDDNKTTRIVEVSDSHGFEAPKPPPVPTVAQSGAPGAAANVQQQKVMEKAIERATDN